MGAITWPPSSLVFALAMSSDAPCRTIVFSHANSFPASTYRPLFAYWREAGFNVQAVEQYGHDPRYPVTQDWPHLVEQLRDFIVQQGASPVYLVGHSLGGYLSLMLAARFPQLAQGVVVLDSPLVNGWRAMSLHLARATGLIDRVMPSGIAAQRCHEWPSLSATRQHFQAKPKFAAFHPEVFNAYVSDGTADHAVTSVRHLRFDRQVEAAIYLYDAVAEAIVFGVPDDRLGEEVGTAVRHLVPAFELGGVFQTKVCRQIDDLHTRSEQLLRLRHCHAMRRSEEHHIARFECR